jgi:hypothetical protein
VRTHELNTLSRSIGTHNHQMLSFLFLHNPFAMLIPAHLERPARVARVRPVLETHKVLLDAPRAHEAVEERDAARLVVGPARARAAERLLADDRAGALLVVVHVPRRVPQRGRRADERGAVGGEAMACSASAAMREREGRIWTHMEPVSAYEVVLSIISSVRSKSSSSYTNTVSTGPKISSTIVTERGSCVRMTVGWTKKPTLASPVPPTSTSPPPALACSM